MATSSHNFMLKQEMILAYLNDLKNQTRRLKGLGLININANKYVLEKPLLLVGDVAYAVLRNTRNGLPVSVRYPYGVPGDPLWFRETWKLYGEVHKHYPQTLYRADLATKKIVGDTTWIRAKHYNTWQSSMFMREQIARFTDIRIRGVRLERLLDISEEDARNKGCEAADTGALYPSSRSAHGHSYRLGYFKLWDKINGKKMPHEKNPWLWVYTFERNSEWTNRTKQ